MHKSKPKFKKLRLVVGCLLFFSNQFLFAQEPKLVLPVGHTSVVTSAVYSPDGKYILTASWDNTAKIWQASDGRLLTELKGHSESLLSASYSHDGKYIVTASKDSTAKIWRAIDGRLLQELKGHKHWVIAASFSPDGKYVLTASPDGTARIWQVSTGKFLKTLKGHTGELTTAQFSPDGKFIVTSSWDSTAKIWQFSDAKMLRELKGHEDFINAASYNPNGKFIITSSNDNTAKIWEAATGNLKSELKGHKGIIVSASFSPDGNYVVTASSDHTAKIWLALNGEYLHQLKAHTGAIVSAKFSPDGKYIATASADSTVNIWNAADGALLNELKGHTDELSSVIFSPDSKNILSASWDQIPKIWQTFDGRLLSELKGHTKVITSATFSPDGKYIVAASWDSTAKIWNAADGRLLTNLKGHTNWVNAAVFSPDGKYVLTASYDNTARLWEVPGGKFLREFKGHEDYLNTALFSPDGKYIVTASWDNTAKVWQVSDGALVSELKGHTRKIRTANFSPDGKYIITASWDSTAKIWHALDGHLLKNLKGHRDEVRTAVFSPDGKFIVTSSWDKTAKIWQASDGRFLTELKGHKARVNSAIFSPDGKNIVTSSMDNTARIWQANTGKLISELKGHKQSVNSTMYSPDGKIILTESWDNTAKIWNASTGKLLNDLKGHAGSLKSATFSYDGTYIVTTSEDNTLKKWNALTGNFLYTFFAVDSIDYLIINNHGQYDGTEAARKMLYYVCENEIVDLEQFKDLTWEPNLAGKINGLNKERITAKKLSEINICNYTPGVEEKDFSNGMYHYEITPKKGGVGEVQLYVNNKLVQNYDPSLLTKKGNSFLLSVSQEKVSDYFVSNGDNAVVVKATTSLGSMISRGGVLPGLNEKKSQGNPNIYILSIGVSQYKGELLKLSYASKDARDFSQVITASAQKLLNINGRQNVHTYIFNTEAGSRRWPAKADIEKLIDTIALKAKADDILIIFFAGHGVLQAGEKNFYLLTAEASGFELNGIEKEVAISTNELKEWLRKIKANKQVLILDACNSGEVIQNFQELVLKRDVPADQQRALESLKDKTGMFILSASASGQSAYEASIYGQGLLTYSLLSGIKFGGGLRDNKFIDITQWFNFASENAKGLAQNIGRRQDPQILGNASFVVGMVDKEVTDNIKLSLEKMVFRRSLILQYGDDLDDDLNITDLVNKELNNLSQKNKESLLVYAPDNTLAGGYEIRGRYSLKENNIAIKIFLNKQKERVHEFEEMTVPINKKDELAGKIVEMVHRFLKQN